MLHMHNASPHDRIRASFEIARDLFSGIPQQQIHPPGQGLLTMY
jgi:hypothetical protein